MINLLITALTLLLLSIGGCVGYFFRDIQDRVKRLENAQVKNKPGVTFGSYRKADELAPTNRPLDKKSGVVIPKTPQKIEWDEQQERLKQNMSPSPK